ncbi:MULTISPECIES: AraC family transcriptional regulator [unclassified Myxococcus]|uniref:helix-turn-helix domain-containing protein n=1 Tax=unclassified Myxococcus TaxID=2648731 RepID=UPI001C2CEFCD|nr:MULTISPECIES: AraC family transcriptional regulator [unclassified Myxococcus]
MSARLPWPRIEPAPRVPHAGPVTSQSLQVEAHGALAGFVRGFRAVPRDAGGGPAYVRLPDGEAELIVRLSDTRGDAYVIGTRLHVLQKGGTEVPPLAVAVRFKAGGAYPFFGVPMAHLTDRVVNLDTLWGEDGAHLRERMHESTTLAAKVQVLETALTERLRRGDVFEPASAHVVRRAVRAISQSQELPRIEALARGLGVSERQLRRAFDDVVGMSPKVYARIVRFQRAMRASTRAATPDWGAIAAATGYYDQAHLISDFRSLTGVTPVALLRAGPLAVMPGLR